MNVYFIEYSFVNEPIKQLKAKANYCDISQGDVCVLEFERKLVLVALNKPLCDNMRLSDFAIVAQVICESCPRMMPILYKHDGIRLNFSDINSLDILTQLFEKERFAKQILVETILLAKHEISARDLKLTLEVLRCNELVISKSPYLNEGKLVIVEKFFDDKMKKQFYDMLELGKTEREALVLIGRKYPSKMNSILKQIDVKDIYLRQSF